MQTWYNTYELIPNLKQHQVHFRNHDHLSVACVLCGLMEENLVRAFLENMIDEAVDTYMSWDENEENVQYGSAHLNLSYQKAEAGGSWWVPVQGYRVRSCHNPH